MKNDPFLQDLRGVFQSALKSLAGAWSQALARRVDVQLGEIRPVDMEELEADFSGEVVFAPGTLVTEAASEIGYLLSTRWAATWADMIYGGNGQKDFAAEQHLPAASQLLNQISGEMSQYLSSIAGFAVQISEVQCSLRRTAELTETVESQFRVDFVVAPEGMKQALLTLLVSPQTVQALRKIPILRKRVAEDRPPPAVLEEEEVFPSSRPEVRQAKFEDFSALKDQGGNLPQNIDVLMDLELPVVIELGRTSMFIRDILDLSAGSVVELEKLSGDPVDLYVNDKKFALGEVVVIDENFGIRITDLVKVEDRIRSLK